MRHSSIVFLNIKVRIKKNRGPRPDNLVWEERAIRHYSAPHSSLYSQARA
jgi:hypothetical protein